MLCGTIKIFLFWFSINRVIRVHCIDWRKSKLNSFASIQLYRIRIRSIFTAVYCPVNALFAHLLFWTIAFVIDQSTLHQNVNEIIFVFTFHFKLTKFSQFEIRCSFFVTKITKWEKKCYDIWVYKQRVNQLIIIDIIIMLQCQRISSKPNEIFLQSIYK